MVTMWEIMGYLIWQLQGGEMMSKRKKTQFEESLRLNMWTYAQYVELLTQLALSRFEWAGLPDTVDARYLELKLFENGSVVYFRDEVIGDLCLSCLPRDNFDVYGVPIGRRAWSGYNSYSKDLEPSDSVIIWNNMIHTNSVLMVELYAKRLYNIDRIIEVNCNAQKTPVLIKCGQNQRLTLQNVYKEYDGNAPVIYADESFNENSLKSFGTSAPFVADKLYNTKIQIWNETLTYLGISNSSVTKRERVQSDEVNRALGGTFGCRFSALSERQRAAEAINKMFGTNISVKFRDVNENSMEGGDGNGEIYDGSEVDL